METGTKVTFKAGPHAGSTNFVRFAGNTRGGDALLEVVGLAGDGNIATYTFKSAQQLGRWGMEAIK
jgi:hypothetical protein